MHDVSIKANAPDDRSVDNNYGCDENQVSKFLGENDCLSRKLKNALEEQKSLINSTEKLEKCLNLKERNE